MSGAPGKERGAHLPGNAPRPISHFARQSTTATLGRQQVSIADVLSRLEGVRRIGDRSFMACCPAHADKTPSLSVREIDGRVKPHCFAGCAESDVWAALDLERPSEAIDPLPTRASKPCPTKAARLRDTWRETLSADHPTAEPLRLYLRNRGIHLDRIPDVLWYHPALPYYGDGGALLGRFSAMLALVVDGDGNPVTLHRTYLTPDGYKADVPGPKKLMSPATEGATRGAAVRLFEPGRTLAVTEGIETALAVYLATGIPTWAAISAGGMRTVCIPPTVSEVVIASDRDANGIGQAAARELERRLLRCGFAVRVVLPDSDGQDWLDVYRGDV